MAVQYLNYDSLESWVALYDIFILVTMSRLYELNPVAT